MLRQVAASIVTAALSIAAAQSALSAESLWINAGESTGLAGTVQFSLDSASVRAASPSVTQAFVKLAEPGKEDVIRKVDIVCPTTIGNTGLISWGQGYNAPRSFAVMQIVKLACVPGMSQPSL